MHASMNVAENVPRSSLLVIEASVGDGGVVGVSFELVGHGGLSIGCFAGGNGPVRDLVAFGP